MFRDFGGRVACGGSKWSSSASFRLASASSSVSPWLATSTSKHWETYQFPSRQTDAANGRFMTVILAQDGGPSTLILRVRAESGDHSPPARDCRTGPAEPRALAGFIHDHEDTKGLFCYKHVVETVFVRAREAFACLTIAQHSVCCSPIFFSSRPCCSSISGRVVPMAEPCC